MQGKGAEEEVRAVGDHLGTLRRAAIDVPCGVMVSTGLMVIGLALQVTL